MSKDVKFFKVIRNTSLFILILIIVGLLVTTINENLFNNYKFWYCSGDKNFVGKYREFSWKCIVFIKHFREPFILVLIGIGIIFISISELIEYANKKK